MWLYRFTTTVGKPLFHMYWRLRFIGEVDSIPARGPLIVAANHASFLDPWFILLQFPRPIRFLVTRQWYTQSALWKAFFDGYGCVPVQAEGASATVRATCEVLERGEVVGVFPEGRISYDGRLGRFRSGFAHLAARSGAPVVPIGVSGAFESLPRQRRVPYPGLVEVNVGKPLRFPGSPCRSTNKEVVEFRNRVFELVHDLSGSTRRDVASSPAGAFTAADRDTTRSSSVKR